MINVMYVRAQGKRIKVGMLGRMTEAKFAELSEKKIVIEHIGPMVRKKRKIQLKNLTQWQ